MSANVETMMYVREVPWHGLGTMVAEAPTSKDALRLAGLDWKVEGRPIYDADGQEIHGFVANTRDSDGQVLGVVTNKYRVVQNEEAFAFTDHLIGGEVRYETAGSLRGGRQVWLLARMPAAKVAGDEVEPYLCFTNSHDCSSSVKVCMTPIRVVCNNTLNLALNSARRTWSMVHTGDISRKILEAQQTLELADRYMVELDAQAQRYANTTVRESWLNEMLAEWFPIQEDDGEQRQKNIQRMRDEFMVAYMMPDIKQFRGTAWGVINAASDMLHNEPRRKTETYDANNWSRIMVGHPLLDMVVSSCSALCK